MDQTARILPRSFLAALVGLALAVSTATAGPFSNLFVFGDSLSDIGNISQATIGFVPGRYYWNGRFSNGAAYDETLATGLGLPALNRSTAGGNNFAYGGAQTSTDESNDFILDIDEQVDQFLATRSADPNALFLVWAGANDLLGGQTNMSVPVNNLAEDIGRLIAAGAKSFLVFNLPLLGNTPRYNGNPTNASQYNTRSQQFNAALATMLNEMQTSNPDVTMYRFDVAALFNAALANPQAYGLTNVTSPAAPGLESGALFYNTNQIAANPNQYAFWDDLHPTAAVHMILARRALDLFLLPGDFNRDNKVDGADYVVWRNGLGTTHIPDDYRIWRSHFGMSIGSGGAAGTSLGLAVPEPDAKFFPVLSLCGIMIAIMARRRPITRFTSD